MSLRLTQMQADVEKHEKIKMLLRLAGSSLSQIARELSVAPTTVTTVSQGYRRSKRIETAIAAKLGLDPSELWRERYASPRRSSIDSTENRRILEVDM